MSLALANERQAPRHIRRHQRKERGEETSAPFSVTYDTTSTGQVPPTGKASGPFACVRWRMRRMRSRRLSLKTRRDRDAEWRARVERRRPFSGVRFGRRMSRARGGRARLGTPAYGGTLRDVGGPRNARPRHSRRRNVGRRRTRRVSKIRLELSNAALRVHA